MSEKQALVDFTTMTSALLGVSFSSCRERVSNQYHPTPSAAKKNAANAGLRYLENIIGGSIQCCAGIQSRHRERKRSNPESQTARVWFASSASLLAITSNLNLPFSHGRALSRPPCFGAANTWMPGTRPGITS